MLNFKNRGLNGLQITGCIHNIKKIKIEIKVRLMDYKLKKSPSVTETLSLHNGSKAWMCVPAAGGWAASSLGSEGAACGALAAASLETFSFTFDKGIGDGRKCLGNPLKNQAPDLFHT